MFAWPEAMLPSPHQTASFAQVAVGGAGMTVAFLRGDGSLSVAGDGWSWGGVPALPAGLTYVEVAFGSGHVLARRSDGTSAR